MRVERVVLDANVLISAALSPKGAPREVVEAVRSAGGVLLFSRETFDELRTRFLRPKFDNYVCQEGRAAYLAQLETIFGMGVDKRRHIGVSRSGRRQAA